MITISQSGSFQGTGRTVSYRTSGGFLGTNFVLGLSIPIFGGFGYDSGKVLGRVHHGSRSTSKAKNLGMHDCYHEKFHGNLHIISETQFDFPANAVSRTDYSPSTSHSVVMPSNGLYFRGHEATSKCMWKSYSANVGTKAPAGESQSPYCTFPSWCCFSATAPKWLTWPDSDYASTIYRHFAYLGRREDGAVIIGVSTIKYDEVVRKYSPVSYQVTAERRIVAHSAIGPYLREATYFDNKWGSSYGTESVAVTANEARDIISSGSGLVFPQVPIPEYSVLPKLNSNELFSGRISVDVIPTSFDRPTFEEYLNNLVPVVSSISPEFVDDRLLHDDLIDDLKYIDINSIAYLAEIKRVGDTFRSIVSATHGKLSAKEISSLWLSLRYGDRLTILDSLDILNGLTKVSKNSLRPSRYQTHRMRRLKSFSSEKFGCTFPVRTMQASSLYYRDADLGPICDRIRTLMEWDLWPSLKNAWDLIPFSFVIDWFVRVEDLARAIDRRIQSQYYDVFAVCDGKKVEIEIPRDFLPSGFEGQLIWSRYTRRISNRLSFSPFRCDAGRPSGKNVVDGISLVIQASS